MKKIVLFLACSSLVGFNMAAEDNPAEPIYKEGEELFDQYDDAQAQMLLQQPIDTMVVGSALLDGYDLFLKALPLDSVPEVNKDGSPKIDKKTGKQKIKTKFSKKIVDKIAGHHNDFLQVGQMFNEIQKYDLAAKAWDIYAYLPSAEFLGDKKPELPDSTIAQFRYYAGVMYFQAKDNEKSLDVFYEALKLGYDYKETTDMIKYLVGLRVDDCLKNKKFDECDQLLAKAMQECPNEAVFLLFKGILVESQTEDIEQAFKYYKEAAEKDPTLAIAQYHVGRYYNNKAVNLMNAPENLNLTDEELGELIDPICLQAKPYLEKAVELDPANSEAQRMLNWVNDRLKK